MRRAAIGMLLVACQSTRDPISARPDPELATEARLLRARDRVDVAAMRGNGWGVWERLQDRWEGWPSSDVVFGAPDRRFRALQPFLAGDHVEVETLPIMFTVVFDPSAAAHVRRSPGIVPVFPRSAIALKAVWYPVHREGLTRLPVWDDAPAHPDEAGNPIRTWTRSVMIDPGIGGADHNADDGDRIVDGVHHVPLSAFVYRTLETTAEIAAARAASRDVTLAAGDSVVLIGMHVATKQIPAWVWATLWWHDRPDAGPFAADRPATLRGPAAHYLMAVAYSAQTPEDADGSPHSAMNPYLEARFPGGLHSNCVACHQRAAYGAVDYLPVTRGTLATGDPYFDGKTSSDFVWSLALER
ncbi:MAG: hypothetical protein ABI867_16660 [Kofleriaceae bacterium]